MFKGELEDGSIFTIENGLVSHPDPMQQRIFQYYVDYELFEYYPHMTSMNNSMGKAIIKRFGGVVLAESYCPYPQTFDPDAIY